MTTAETAVERFQKGHSCSQAVFSALAEPMGLDYETAVRIASGFGGGMGRQGDVCGAVTGAYMALGLKTGGAGAEEKEETYRLVNRFVELFQKRHQSLECRDLIGCDLSTHQGRQESKARATHDTICVGLVRDAVEIAEELLQQDG